jgi:hypothetical protein
MMTTLYAGVFHGAPDQVTQVRHELARYLDGCLVSDDTVLIASELASNAIVHSDSRGAFFIVRAGAFPSYVRIEVEDLGGPWHPRQRDGRPHGLDIVAALVGGDWGTEVTSDGDRIVWARVDFQREAVSRG